MTLFLCSLALGLYLIAALKLFYIHLHRYPAPKQFTVPGIPDFTPYADILAAARIRWEAAEKEEVSLRSYDGLLLKGLYFPCENARGTAVLSHGYHCTARHDYMHMLGVYLDRGFSVLLFDQRACGKSEGAYITMGVKESRDVADWCRFAAEKTPGKPILLHGMSMGGATALMATDRLPEAVKALVIDCAYCTPHETVSYVFRAYPLCPVRFLLPGVELWARLLAGFSLWERSTEKALRTNTRPVLFLHGDPDGLVPTGCTKRNAAVCRAEHRVLYIPGAGHTECFLKGRPEALSALDAFLQEWLA